MDDIMEKLEGLKGEELTLLQMDNKIQGIVGTDGGSISDGNLVGLTLLGLVMS